MVVRGNGYRGAGEALLVETVLPSGSRAQVLTVPMSTCVRAHCHVVFSLLLDLAGHSSVCLHWGLWPLQSDVPQGDDV